MKGNVLSLYTILVQASDDVSINHLSPVQWSSFSSIISLKGYDNNISTPTLIYLSADLKQFERRKQ